MKLSIFSNANPHPKSKEEKDFYAKFCSSPYRPEVVEIESDKDLIYVVTSSAWSPAIFKTYRKNSEFVSTDFMVLDIDHGLTIEDATQKCKQLDCTFLILPTTNHTPENHRFRVILPLLTQITTISQYKENWQKLREVIPELDEQCSDVARFYFGSKIEGSVCHEGKLLQPVQKQVKMKEVTNWVATDKETYKNDNEILRVFSESIPEAVDYFYKNAYSGLNGSWICSINNCVFTLALYGFSPEYIWGKMEEISPEPLDKKDSDAISRAIKDGTKKRLEKE